MSNSSNFKNLKIIDLSTVLAGPSVGTFFAELGAEVIKIEHPIYPDITRSWKLPMEDQKSSVSAYFSSINYMKTYQQLNLKEDAQREQLYELVKTADIILMNFKFGDQEKLKVTDEILRGFNSQLIIGKINGYGDKSDRVAYDLILQAESGIMSMNGTPESGPVKMPVAFIDVLAAHHLKEGLLIELFSKKGNENYKGKSVTVSLYEAAVSSLANQASNYLMNNAIPQRIGSLHPNIAPYGELFNTSDDRIITFAIGSHTHFSKLCEYLELSELPLENRFSSVQNRVKNRTELFEILKEKVKEHSADEILKYMNEHFVPCGEIKDLKAVFETELAQELVRTEMIDGIETKRVSALAFRN
ncbi:CaiB/BaiF CoA transferase family protein [Brumimicrobium oceani]|uniref:Carnitine dehydratase n=1 Tax=Brumimicrobium oceani TaxID=2100725 RepID=A0A2U2XEJ6_9FLAO|nr:CoA transferase [Brumimicrobium oceani]PWH86193.1 carnitine dehydratase [Brumimicrobium oceani]